MSANSDAAARRHRRWVYVPALIALLLITPHAIEDDGLGAWPYLALLCVAVAHLVRPTVVGWALLAAPFTVFTIAMAAIAMNNREASVFLVVFSVPTICLLSAGFIAFREAR